MCGTKSKRAALYLLCAVMALLMWAMPARAAWTTTSDGVIYTASNAKGYYTGWHKIGGKWYFFNRKTGIMATGIQKIKVNKKTFTFIFGKDGARLYGFTKWEGDTYYLSADKGRMQFGYFTVNGKKYYADEKTGVLARRMWVGDVYFQADGSMARSTYVNGVWVGSNGKAATGATKKGFVKTSSGICYYKSNGKRATGWQTISGSLYYFNGSGVMKTGWFTVGSKTYYAGGNGVVRTSTFIGKYYLDSTGARAKGWQTISKKRYYFGSNGEYVTGWQTIDDDEYYFESNGVLKTSSYVTTGSKTYYVDEDGVKVKGVHKIGKSYYYFAITKGARLKGLIRNRKTGKRYYANPSNYKLYRKQWLTLSGKTYYATEDCSLATGLQKIGGKLYYFGSNSVMVKRQMVTVNGDSYFFGVRGFAITNAWRKVNGKYYYLGSDGKVLKDTIIKGYVVDSNGVRTKKLSVTSGWLTVSGKTYYFESGTPATGWRTIYGSKYYFDSKGVMVSGLQKISGKNYFFYQTGVLATSVTIASGSKEYTTNASGVVTATKTVSVTSTSTGKAIAAYAQQFVGNPYVYGGTSLTKGADCSGFVYTVFANFGIKLLRVANDQMAGPSSLYIKAGYKKAVVVSYAASTKTMLPGDLIFYGYGNYASHVAIYIGNGKIVHASNSQPYPAGGIKISNYNYSTPIRVVRYWS